MVENPLHRREWLSRATVTALASMTTGCYRQPNQTLDVDWLIYQEDRSPQALMQCVRSLGLKRLPEAADMLGQRLMDCDGGSPTNVIGQIMELLRSLYSCNIEIPSQQILPFLAANSTIYHQRAKPDVIRLRSFALVTASMLGHGRSILGLMIENLVNGMSAIEIASAARAARFAPKNKQLLAAIEIHLAGIFNDGFMSLDRYVQTFPESESTSAFVELLRTVAYYGTDARHVHERLTTVQQQRRASLVPSTELLNSALNEAIKKTSS